MKKKLIIRLYGPRDPFHRRKTYSGKNSGDNFWQVAIGEWALMFFVGSTSVSPFFMFVNGDKS